MSRASRRLLIAALATSTAAAVLVVALVVTAFAALASRSDGAGDTGTDGSGGSGSAIRTAACSSTGAPAPGLTAEQSANAAVIVAVAGERGLGVAGAVIGVMTALTESSLLNVDYGDDAGPDSRGLFQQRDSWGPVAVRVDPAGATGLFFDRLETIAGWQQLSPWMAAQQVQHSAFAGGSNYAAHYNVAVAAVRELAGGTGVATPNASDPTGTSAADPDADGSAGFDMAGFCGSGTGGVSAGGWGGYSNGLIPAAALCPLIAAGQLLRCDAATAWDAMSAAFQAASHSTDTPLDLAVFAEEPWIWLHRDISPDYHDAIAATCRATGFSPTPVHWARSVTSQIATVSSGLGVTIVPVSAVRSNGSVRFRRPQQARSTIGLAAMTRVSPEPLPALLTSLTRDAINRIHARAHETQADPVEHGIHPQDSTPEQPTGLSALDFHPFRDGGKRDQREVDCGEAWRGLVTGSALLPSA